MRNERAQLAHAPEANTRLRLPLGALTAMATASFITVLTEALPGGLLPAMSTDLRVGESSMGQAVTIYAIGSAVAAIPLSAATSGWRRKRLLLTTMVGFAIANTMTAVSGQYLLTMVGRFIAGVCGGLVWAMMAGYARRMVPGSLHGKAIAVAMVGTPLALALGVPAGTLLGQALGWRVAFWAMTVIALVVLAWLGVTVPDFPGEHRQRRSGVAHTLRLPGVAPVLFVVLTVVLAHTVLYTYIATFLDKFGMIDSTALVLFVFGAASVAATSVVGSHIHRRLRILTITGTLFFAAAATLLATLADSPVIVYVAAVLWGLGFGGMATLLQTALGDAAGAAADTAQAMLVTLWNTALALGGVIGGLLLDGLGAGSFPWFVLVILAPAIVTVAAAGRHGFPSRRTA
ncbi:MFS transporter [Streptomyces gibsoniae]|uniref:MFS transporter n=1 Tax=Streptomyces gibsoniae TaxID=3075529 RepID=A0ABU2U9H3_9ACTN|nr:MFS transporter [Streptomyces sp. DSM 41699]MDT0469871.1 MFS transporter [Streptomyces sp. DSM 41699]